MRALVVDGSRAVRALLREILAGFGAEVFEAVDGPSALGLVARDPHLDLALVARHLPAMDGLEFVRALRRRPEWRHMAVVMVARESEQESVVRALLVGANEYLVTPFTQRDVAEKLALIGLLEATAPLAARSPAGGSP